MKFRDRCAYAIRVLVNGDDPTLEQRYKRLLDDYRDLHRFAYELRARIIDLEDFKKGNWPLVLELLTTVKHLRGEIDTMKLSQALGRPALKAKR